MMGHFVRDCRRKGTGKGKSGDGSKGYPKGKDKETKGAGKKGSGKYGYRGRNLREKRQAQ